MKSSDEICQEIADLENELKKAISAREVVELEAHRLAREILVLRTTKKDIEIAIEKARNNTQRINIDLRLKRQEFWTLKEEGL